MADGDTNAAEARKNDTPKNSENGNSSTEPQPLRVLHIEDNAMDAELVGRALRKDNFAPITVVVQSEAEFERQLGLQVPDIVLADYNLPQWKGMEALDVLRRLGLDVPLILISGALGDVNAVECIKRGATDYVLKDSLTRLPETIRRALQERSLLRARHRAEEELARKALELARKAEELARSNADLEQFAYVASHDLQEPLRMVAAYTQLLSERYRGKLDENADKFLGYANEGAVRMQTLIQDLLAFSRVGRGGAAAPRAESKEALEQALVNLAGAIQQSGAMVKYGAEYGTEYGALPAVAVERAQLAQVFQNLIGNAIKFRGAEAPVVSIRGEPEGERWLFTVRDNGIGIPAEHAQHIFVVFQRLHARTEYPGNGIGLAICKKIVERSGGRIWVETGGEHGSVFKFTLPAAAEASEKKAAAAAGV